MSRRRVIAALVAGVFLLTWPVPPAAAGAAAARYAGPAGPAGTGRAAVPAVPAVPATPPGPASVTPVTAPAGTVHLPRPTGRWRVGTLSAHLVDPARRDPYAPVPQPRELMVQGWYP
ncbi:MAG TPA: hypothetical protein VNV66_06980, partial [Pilimelia sp.]|nr:hypothetical protein [Pilimelia sp.]